MNVEGMNMVTIMVNTFISLVLSDVDALRIYIDRPGQHIPRGPHGVDHLDNWFGHNSGGRDD